MTVHVFLLGRPGDHTPSVYGNMTNLINFLLNLAHLVLLSVRILRHSISMLLHFLFPFGHTYLSTYLSRVMETDRQTERGPIMC